MILADPPWEFRARSDKGYKKSPQAHYSCERVETLAQIPVAQWAADDAMIFMWATSPMLPQALELMQAWGFTFVTQGQWHKKTKNGKTQFGTGYRLRSASEPFLIGTRGKMPLKARNLRNLIEAQVREHSRKPDIQYAYCEGLADGPYLEMFARQRYADHWDVFGNETDKFDTQRDTHDHCNEDLAGTTGLAYGERCMAGDQPHQ